MLRATTFCFLTTLLGLADLAEAGQIYINSPLVTIESSNGVGGANYRLSNTNFDQRIQNGANPVTGPDQLTGALGNVAQLSGRGYLFTLEHVAGEGLIFQMTQANTGTTSTLSWGTFGVPQLGANAATLNGQAPPTTFNAFEIEARASRAGSTFSFSDLAFSGAGLSVADGAFFDGVALPGTDGGFVVQRLFSDVNLGGVDWTLTGRIAGTRTGSGGDETVRFNIGLKQVDAAVVPEPSTLAMAGLGILAVGGVGLRRRVRRGATTD